MTVAIFTAGDKRAARRRRARRIGWGLIGVAVVVAIVVAVLPSSYVIEEPGPVFNTLGTTTVGTRTVPVLSISGHPTYPTSGSLDMLTVNIAGDPIHRPSWSEIVTAWFDPSKTITPIDEIYAPQETVQQSNQQGTEEMADSQQQATAAALYQLGITFDSVISVEGTAKGSPASKSLQKGDVLKTLDGKSFIDSDQLHSLVVANGTDKPATITFERKGVLQTAKVTPEVTQAGAYLGVYIGEKFTFPFTVKVQLQNVGGPSAGMMFALGIIDKLTPGELNGGRHVAGTGTISAYGLVGAIGGIRQKMYGARAAGATYFLAPASNCDEVRGHIPSGLTVFATSTLKQSVTDLKAIASGHGLNKLQTCG
jgi:PDZ domain-containing protein